MGLALAVPDVIDMDIYGKSRNVSCYFLYPQADRNSGKRYRQKRHENLSRHTLWLLGRCTTAIDNPEAQLLVGVTITYVVTQNLRRTQAVAGAAATVVCKCYAMCNAKIGGI
jgi:hypothetical protein